MDETERLTSYLDGELAADERRALEAELAGDHVLRARLAGLRAADEALRGLAATELPPGARQRLDDRLAGVLDEVLSTTSSDTTVQRLPTGGEPVTAAEAEAAPTPATVTDTGHDELTQRRRRRVVPAVTGVAAGLVLLAGGLVGLGQLGLGSDEVDTAERADALLSADDAAELEALPAGPELEARAPIVVDDGRAISSADLAALLASPELAAVAAQALPREDGAAVAARFQQLLLGAVAPATPESMADDVEDDEVAPSAGPEVVTRDGRVLGPADVADLQACLTALLEGDEQAIPIRIELLELDGVPAVSVGLVTPDPRSGAYTRVEVWTLERASCQVLRFDQA